MAREVKTKLIDDLDGSDADTTVTFGLDGVEYQIDLSAGNAEAMSADFAQYVQAARRTGGRKRTGGNSARNDRKQNQAIRDWARQNGYDVSERGRIPSEVVEAYQKGTPAPGHPGAPDKPNTVNITPAASPFQPAHA